MAKILPRGRWSFAPSKLKFGLFSAATVVLAIAAVAAVVSNTSAVGVVTFKLDYSAGTAVPPWKGVQAASTSRVTVVNDPAGSGTKVGRFELRAGDRYNGAARTEVYNQTGTSGTEFNGADDYYPMSVYFPTGFKSSKAWGLFMQMHGATGVGNEPPVALETRPYPSDQLRLVVRGGDVNKTITTKTFDPTGMTIARDKWQDFILHWKKSPVNGQGIVELWYRTGSANPFVKVVSSYTGPNFYIKGSSAPGAYIKEGYYRDPGASNDTTYPHIVYHKGVWKTTDFNSAMTYFGSPTPPPDTTVPTVPSGLNATNITQTGATLNWSASSDSGGSGLAGYRVYRNNVQINSVTTTSYSDTGLSPSTAYSYTVVAYDNATNSSTASNPLVVTTQSPPPPPDTTAPTVPTGLNATNVTDSSATINWNPTTDTGGSGLAGYYVYRDGLQVATTASTNFADVLLNPSTDYHYTVAAYDNATNVSLPSDPLLVTTQAPPPPDTTAPTTPTGLNATNVTQTGTTLNWSASSDSGGSGLAGYRVYRNNVQINSVTTTSYSDTGLSAGNTYSYTIIAYDNATNPSIASDPLAVTTQTPPPPPSGSMLTKLDYSAGFLTPPWEYVTAAAADRITIVSDPAGSGKKVARFELRAGDLYQGASRAEVYHKLHLTGGGTIGTEYNGDDDYYALSVYFPTGFKAAKAWGLFTQIHGASGVGNQPPIALENRPYPSQQLRLAVRGGDVNGTITTKTFDPPGMVMTPGQWQDFILHWKKSAVNGQGVTELWFRTGGSANQFTKVIDPTTGLDKYTGPNFYVKGADGPPAYIKQGYYRDVGTSSDTTYPHIIYHKGVWKTTDYSSAASYFTTL